LKQAGGLNKRNTTFGLPKAEGVGEPCEQNGPPKGDFSRILALSLSKPQKRRSKLYVIGTGKEMLLDIQIAI